MTAAEVSVEQVALTELKLLRGPIEVIRDLAPGGECDCAWAARSSLRELDRLVEQLLDGKYFHGDFPSGLDETLDDALACARHHINDHAVIDAAITAGQGIFRLTKMARAVDSRRLPILELWDSIDTRPVESPIDTRPVESPSATRLIGAAVRVLPIEHRSRWGEEFRSELHEIAEAGGSRRDLLRYALRLFDRAWVLRAELRAATPRRARS